MLDFNVFYYFELHCLVIEDACVKLMFPLFHCCFVQLLVRSHSVITSILLDYLRKNRKQLLDYLIL